MHYPPWTPWSSYTCHTILYHDNIKVLSKESMSHSIFGLLVTTRYHTCLTIFTIVHMACHRPPIFQLFHIIKHDSRILHITSNLHTLHQLHSTTWEIHRHLEDAKHFDFQLIEKRLPWTNLNPKWSFNVKILSMVPIPLRMKCHEPCTKLRQLGNSNSRNFKEPYIGDLRMKYANNSLFMAIIIAEFLH